MTVKKKSFIKKNHWKICLFALQLHSSCVSGFFRVKLFYNFPLYSCQNDLLGLIIFCKTRLSFVRSLVHSFILFNSLKKCSQRPNISLESKIQNKKIQILICSDMYYSILINVLPSFLIKCKNLSSQDWKIVSKDFNVTSIHFWLA